MKWLLLLWALGPGDVYREFPDAKALTPDQLMGALRAENTAGEVSLSLLRGRKVEGPVRVYFGASIEGPKGRILAPRNGATIKDDPEIRLEAEGDGELWAYFERLGSAWHRIAPEWKTQWVPDQPKGGIKFQLRIRRADGLWAVARQVEDVTLERKKLSVKIFQAGNPGAEAMAGATEAAWLIGEEIRPVPLDQIGTVPAKGAALLVRFAR
jgi:hypothetical protein